MPMWKKVCRKVLNIVGLSVGALMMGFAAMCALSMIMYAVVITMDLLVH